MANAITGRENFGSILSGLNSITKRLDIFIGQQESDATKAAEAARLAAEKASTAQANIDHAKRVRSRVVDLVA